MAKNLGRPAKSKYKINFMVEKINQYIQEKRDDLPILKECCLINDWNYDYVMQLQRENPALSQSIKKLLDWKEVNLEKGALTGRIDKTMAIFSLKQPAHGWSDNPIHEDNSEELSKISEVLISIRRVAENAKD